MICMMIKKYIFRVSSESKSTLHSKQLTELNTPYLKQVAVGKRDAQILYLGISYRFGKIIKKQNEEKLQFDNNL